jgi:hypothetical protein
MIYLQDLNSQEPANILTTPIREERKCSILKPNMNYSCGCFLKIAFIIKNNILPLS